MTLEPDWTVIRQVADFVEVLAVTVAVPLPTAVTIPLLLTVQTEVFELLKLTLTLDVATT